MRKLNNTNSKINKNNFYNCKVKTICDQKITICLETEINCEYKYSFGDKYFCIHPNCDTVISKYLAY